MKIISTENQHKNKRQKTNDKNKRQKTNDKNKRQKTLGSFFCRLRIL